jgi:hypothetical protein
MRKEIGKPVRQAFFKGVATRFPCFERTKGQRIPGFIWDWVWQVSPDFVVWLVFQRNKSEDSFTLACAWAPTADEPPTYPLVAPDASLTAERGTFRLGELWDPRGDYWWVVVPGPDPTRLVSHPEAFVEELLAGSPPVPDDLADRVHDAVSDALDKIDQYLLPHIRAMAEARGLAHGECV